MRYFADRSEAGKLLADELIDYSSKNCAVVCLNEGGVVVGLEIAKRLHTSLFLLTSEGVSVPGEPEPVASLSSAGTLTFNNAYSADQLEQLKADYHTLIEQQKIQAFHKLNRIAEDEGTIPKKLLKNHVVILVSDGFNSALSLDIAADFLKPVKMQKLVAASPVASVKAVDRMHILTDEIECLGVVEEYLGTNHYFENNDLPAREQLIQSMETAIFDWDNTSADEPKG